MFVSQLDVVNSCLATMGETALVTLEDDHVYKSAALMYLNLTNLAEQQDGYWFNSEYIWLQPDSTSKFVYVPNDAIEIKPIRNMTPAAVQRGRRLYDAFNNTYLWERPVPVDIVRAVDFEDLPFSAANVVRLGTAMRFQQQYDGDNTRYQQLGQEYIRAKAMLGAQDMRNRRPNLLDAASNQISMQQIGPFNRVGPFMSIR